MSAAPPHSLHPVPRALRALSALILLCALGLAAWWAIQLARADAAFQEASREAVNRSLRIAPGNLDRDLFAALESEYDGEDAVPQLERIAAEHPRASAPPIRLGLAAEIAGDAATAERWLLKAASVDRQFETRWTLANFYFRQGRPEPFWNWIHSALEFSYGDRTPAFDLVWAMSDDADEILQRALPADQYEVLADYVTYLVGEGNVLAARQAAQRLVSSTGKAYPDATYAAIDALLTADRPGEAAEIWQAMGHAAPSGILFGELHPPGGEAYIGRGFDWRYIAPEGVSHTRIEAAHRISLSGQQNEQQTLLLQIVGGLEPGSLYRLRWEADLRGFADGATGLAWHIGEREMPVVLELGDTNPGIAAGSIVALPRPASGEAEFRATATFDALVLGYSRPLGQARARGALELRSVSLERVDR